MVSQLKFREEGQGQLLEDSLDKIVEEILEKSSEERRNHRVRRGIIVEFGYGYGYGDPFRNSWKSL